MLSTTPALSIVPSRGAFAGASEIKNKAGIHKSALGKCGCGMDVKSRVSFMHHQDLSMNNRGASHEFLTARPWNLEYVQDSSGHGTSDRFKRHNIHACSIRMN